MFCSGKIILSIYCSKIFELINDNLSFKLYLRAMFCVILKTCALHSYMKILLELCFIEQC